MKSNKYKKIAHQVIDLEIQALKKLRKSINNSFDQAVNAIAKCQSKIIAFKTINFISLNKVLMDQPFYKH